MKTIFMVLILGLILCGCSQKQAASRSALDLVQAGKDTIWQSGLVLHVAKRDGSLLEGVRITASDKPEVTYSADKATLSEAKGYDPGSVKIVLFDALCPAGKGTQIHAQEVTFILHDLPPNKSPEPTRDGAFSLPRSRGLAKVAVPAWLSFFR